MDDKEKMEKLRRLQQIAEMFCNVRFVTDKDEKGRDELRIWFIEEGTQIWDTPIGALSDSKIVEKARGELERRNGAGVSGTQSAVNRLKAMFDEAGGLWKMELRSLYIVLNATSVGYRRAWSRRPEAVYELLDFLRSGDVGKTVRGINWDAYPNSVEWTNEKDLP